MSNADLGGMVSGQLASSRGRTRMECYPFSQPVGLVTWQQRGRMPVLILGVYPSAVHARWIGRDGKTRVRALAVADEPEPFWTGHGADIKIATVAAAVRAEAGRLEAAEGHNGRSGLALDELVLAPLGLSRDQVRVADIHNRYMANPGQQAAVDCHYVQLVERGLLPQVTWKPRRPITRIPRDRSPALTDELAEADPAWIITLGNEPLRALGLDPLTQASYGTPLTAVVLDHKVQLLRLAHTRQQAGHGPSSSGWAKTHRNWVTDEGTVAVRRAIMADLGH